MTGLLVQIVGANMPSEEMPNGACVILTGDERAVAEAAKLWGKRVALVRAERVAALETAEADNARLREVLKECADDLESYVNQEYIIELRDKYPNMEAKYSRDMEPVAKARAALNSGEHEDSR
jgi:hypothetical protein